MNTTADNLPMTLPDAVLGVLFASFYWPITGLWKTLFNYPDVRQDRWIIFRASLAGLAVLIMTIASLGCALTTGEDKWWTFVEEYGRWMFAALAYVYFLLTIWRLILYVPQPKST